MPVNGKELTHLNDMSHSSETTQLTSSTASCLAVNGVNTNEVDQRSYSMKLWPRDFAGAANSMDKVSKFLKSWGKQKVLIT